MEQEARGLDQQGRVHSNFLGSLEQQGARCEQHASTDSASFHFQFENYFNVARLPILGVLFGKRADR